jgi:hypothetical protein
MLEYRSHTAQIARYFLAQPLDLLILINTLKSVTKGVCTLRQSANHRAPLALRPGEDVKDRYI